MRTFRILTVAGLLIGAVQHLTAQSCELYPIALSAQQVTNLSPGTILTNVLNGAQPGNFGWLTWAGSPSEGTLVKSLSAPGDASSYANPDNSADHQINAGDWVQAKPGVSNSKNVREALDALKEMDVVVPTWSETRGQGGSVAYRVAGFARIRLLSYQLPQENRITARYLGAVSCGLQNQAPVVNAGADQTNTLPASVTLIGSVSDDGLPGGSGVSVVWSLVSGPTNVIISSPTSTNTSVSFTAAGTYILRLTASDSELSTSDEVMVLVNRENRPPVAVNQSVTNTEDTALSITLQGSDPDGTAVEFSVVTLPVHGVLSGTPPELLYTPFADYSGPDVFTFKARDGLLESGVATVTITNVPVNDAPVADGNSYTTMEDTPLVIALSGSDVEGDTLTFSITLQPTNGTLVLLSSNTVVYQPGTNFFGEDRFWYVANDGSLDSVLATNVITVVPVNDAPIVDAGADWFISLPTNSVTLPGTVRDDQFPLASADMIEWSVVSGPGGVSFGNSNEPVTTATFSASGIYVLRLTASDSLLTGSDDVTVTVNAPPMVNAGPDLTNNWPGTVSLNATVIDDLVPTNGVVSVEWTKVSGPGTVVFGNPQATNTTASFSQSGIYVLKLSGFDTAASGADEVTITVNQAPIVDAGSDQTNTTLTATLNGTVADLDGIPAGAGAAPLWSKVSGPGEVTFENAAAPATTVQFSKSGVYILRLNASDTLASSSDEVTVIVNLPPQAIGQSLSVSANTLRLITLQGTDPENQALSYQILSSPTNGTLTGVAPGLLYTPATNYIGEDSFSFGVSDGFSASAPAVVSITVAAANQPPSADGGPDRVVRLPEAANLAGTVADDGLPNGSVLNVAWVKVSGPGLVYFANAGQASTSASFSEPGTYVLRLSASDGEFVSVDEVTVTADQNRAPIVNAGLDQALSALFPGTNNANCVGKVVVNNDEWTLSNAGFSAAPDAGTFALNVAAWFTGGRPGKFLVYSSNFGLVESELAQRMTNAGHQWIVSRSVAFALTNLLQYDGIFLAGDEADNQVLIDYVNAGGNVYVAGGTGWGGSTAEAARWNTFLNAFGLAFQPFYGVSGLFPITAEHPVLQNVSALYYAGGNPVLEVVPTYLLTSLIASGQGQGFLAVFEGPEAVAHLAGQVTDDGEPAGAGLSLEWSQVSGPSLATIGSTNTALTKVRFCQPGVYVFRLSASDGELTGSDEVTVTVGTESPSPACAPRPFGIAGWWPAEGTNELIAGLNTELIGSVTVTNGLVGQAWRFDGTQGYFRVPASSQTDLGQADGLSLEGWIAPNDVSAQRPLVEWNNGGGGIATHLWQLGSGQFVLHLQSQFGDYRSLTSPGGVLSTNQFYHLAATYDRASGWANLYVNGQLVAQANHGSIIPQTGTDLFFGYRPSGGAAGTRFSGLMDEWTLYRRALSPTEVSRIFEAGSLGKCLDAGLAVSAGPDRLLVLPTNTILQAAIEGFGVTNFAGATFLWEQVDGPATATIQPTNAASITASFSAPGSYTFRVTASLAPYLAADEVAVTVFPPGTTNHAPFVDAGADQVVAEPFVTLLRGRVVDDGLPIGSGVSYAWTQAGGPGTVVFGNPNGSNTSVRFPSLGTYVLRLTASDSQLSASDDVVVQVVSQLNQPPVADAGPDLTVPVTGAAVLNYTVTDDALPVGVLNIVWSMVSGPGTTTFSQDGNVLSARFSVAGEYLLRLTASDTIATNSDDVVVTVLPSGSALAVNAGPDQTIGLPASANLAATVIGLQGGDAATFAWYLVSGLGTVSVNPPQGTVVSSNVPGTAAFGTAGDYVLRLVVNAGGQEASDDVAVTVLGPGAFPVVEIATPLDGSAVTAPTVVTGTVSSAILEAYQLQYRLKTPEDDGEWITLATGTSPVSNGPLGTFDPTLLLNGIYELQLTAVDQEGRTGSTEPVTVIVDRNMKIGHFTVSFKDLSVPLAGIPIEIVRTYDSREAALGRTNDFGPGWTLDIRNYRLQKNRHPGRNWESSGSSEGLGSYCLDFGRERIVSITGSDGHTLKFRARSSPDCQIFQPIVAATIYWDPIENTRGSLVSLDTAGQINDDVLVDGFGGAVDLLDYNGNDYNPTRFRYTTPEGDTYVIDEREGLLALQDRNQNTLSITATGIVHSAGLAIRFDRDTFGRITNIVDPAGASISYRYNGQGDLASLVDRVSLTNRFGYTNNHYLLDILDARGIRAIRSEYDESGRLVRQIDATGHTNSFEHDVAGRREIVTDRLGYTTTHWYDENGSVIQTQDALGNITRMAYDENDNLLEQVDALGNTNRYTYDGQFNKLTETDPLGNTTRYTYDANRQLTSVTDKRGNVTTNIYDTQGRLLSMTDALGNTTSHTYDAAGNLLSTTDPLRHRTENAYDQLGRLTNVVIRDVQLGTLSETCYRYDLSGNQTNKSIRRTTPAGLETLITTYIFDNENRLIGTIHPDASTNWIIYNAIDKPATEVDALGRQTLHDYDEQGRQIEVTYPDSTTEHWVYDAEGRLQSMIDKAQRPTTYLYDALGRRFAIIHPDGIGSTNYFDGLGRVIATTDENGNSTWFGYDARGLRTSLTNALGEVTQFSYDKDGNLVEMVDALGRTNRYEVDALNRRIVIIYPDGTRSTIQYDPLSRKTAQTDQANNTTLFGYDARGLLTSVTNALGHVTRYEYDEEARQVAQIDARNRATRYEYDTMGRRTKRTLPLNQVEICQYDLAGNLTNKTDFNGRATTYIYDSLNRLLSRVPDPLFGAPPVTFAYDAVGLRTNMTDASGVTSYRYDLRDRLIEKATPQGTLFYGYDGRGGVTNISSSTPNGARLSYGYDALNRLAFAAEVHSGASGYSYDAVGNLASCVLPNGLISTYHYDSLNRLTNLSVSRLIGVVANYAYSVNPSGHRASATETLIRDPLNPVAYTIARGYHYDSTCRLTNETISASTMAMPALLDYSYDAVGNRLNILSTLSEIPSAAYGYDANDRLSSDTYDANGNTLFALGFGMSQADRYDFENRLTQRTVAGKTVAIVYDGDGNRVRRTVTTPTNTVTTYFLVDTVNPTGYAQVLEEHVALDGQPPALDRIYAFGHNLLSQWYAAAGVVRFHGLDGHGNTRFLANGQGEITDTYNYDAFGNVVGRTGGAPNNYLFASEQLDPDLGLYFHRARYVNTSTGRFWTADSFEGLTDDASTLHKYVYCQNDPVNGIDPSGNLVFTSNFRHGQKVHKLISEDFRERAFLPLTDLGLSTILGRSVVFGRLRPDLIELGALPAIPPQLYEIKPAGAFIEGQVKLTLYLTVLNALDPRGNVWQPGFSYSPPRVLDLGYSAYAIVSPPVRGVIIYQVVDFKEAAAVAAYELAKLTSQIGLRLTLSSMVRFAF